MLGYLDSSAVDLAIDTIDALINIRSPAPPLIAIAGLLGMILGERTISRMKASMVVNRREAQAKAALVMYREDCHTGG